MLQRSDRSPHVGGAGRQLGPYDIFSNDSSEAVEDAVAALKNAEDTVKAGKADDDRAAVKDLWGD